MIRISTQADFNTYIQNGKHIPGDDVLFTCDINAPDIDISMERDLIARNITARSIDTYYLGAHFIEGEYIYTGDILTTGGYLPKIGAGNIIVRDILAGNIFARDITAERIKAERIVSEDVRCKK